MRVSCNSSSMRIRTERTGPPQSLRFDPAQLDAIENADQKSGAAETLQQRTSRMRARWLKRVMYSNRTSPSENCFGYAVSDHLNCVTLDCWPSQERLAAFFGWASVKTVQRAAVGLEAKGFQMITRVRRGSYRYAPIFLLSDEEDNSVSGWGQLSLVATDKIVNESLLPNLPIGPTPPTPPYLTRSEQQMKQGNRLKERGKYELALAELLGHDGMEILSSLSQLDDAHVQRLCVAFSIGAVGERELAAARLAVEQSPFKKYVLSYRRG